MAEKDWCESQVRTAQANLDAPEVKWEFRDGLEFELSERQRELDEAVRKLENVQKAIRVQEERIDRDFPAFLERYGPW